MRIVDRKQGGVALPVMLIMLAVMLIGSLYLLRSSNSSTLLASSLAYDASQSRLNDLGLMQGFDWLQQTAANNKPALNSDNLAAGYASSFAGQGPGDLGFWLNKKTIQDPTGQIAIDYVIHRMCTRPNSPPTSQSGVQSCVGTASNTGAQNNGVRFGDSSSIDSPQFNGSRQIHYVVTSRINTGPRGGVVINQMVVMIGA